MDGPGVGDVVRNFANSIMILTLVRSYILLAIIILLNAVLWNPASKKKTTVAADVLVTVVRDGKIYVGVKYNDMSGCRIRRNLAPSGSGAAPVENTQVKKEMDDKLIAMLAERERQDKLFSENVMTEEEYEKKYGKQPEAGGKKETK